jgi:hypothetical protein
MPRRPADRGAGPPPTNARSTTSEKDHHHWQLLGLHSIVLHRFVAFLADLTDGVNWIAIPEQETLKPYPSVVVQISIRVTPPWEWDTGDDGESRRQVQVMKWSA